MKYILLAGAIVLAQTNQVQAQTGTLSTSTSIVEVFDASCTDIDLVTDYETITVTTCPACTEQPGPITQHTTVYTTTYVDICETGVTSKPYVITETCTGAQPMWSSGPGYIPQGFTETVTVCTVCGAKPTTMTLTVPCEETGQSSMPAAPGAPGLPQGAPAQQTPATGGVPGSAGGAIPPNVGGSNAAPPYPTGANSSFVKCPGPHCHGTSSLLPSGGVGTSGSQAPKPPINGASIISFSWLHLMLTLGIGLSGVVTWL